MEWSKIYTNIKTSEISTHLLCVESDIIFILERGWFEYQNLHIDFHFLLFFHIAQ